MTSYSTHTVIYSNITQLGVPYRGGVLSLEVFVAAATDHLLLLYGNSYDVVGRGVKIGDRRDYWGIGWVGGV